jgi:hypothetical protein
MDWGRVAADIDQIQAIILRKQGFFTMVEA